MSEWISVKDRLPKHAVSVLGYNPDFEDEKIRKVFLTSRGFFDAFECGCGVEENITHWMPLPEPPKD
jgi:hypothetical protein